MPLCTKATVKFTASQNAVKPVIHEFSAGGVEASAPRPTRGRRPAPWTARRIVRGGAVRELCTPRAEFGRKLLQGCDAVLGRGMAGEEIVDATARQRIDDEHVRGGRIALGAPVRHLLRSAFDPGKRRGEPHRLAGDARAEMVGGVFAGAADRHLHQHGAQRRQDHHRDRAEDARPAIVVAVAAKEHAKLRHHRDSAGDGSGDGHQQRVVISDMREFMRDHAGELLAAELLHQPGGDGDRRVFGIAAGRKGVGLPFIHHEHARHRQASARGKLDDEIEKLGRAVAVDLMGAVE
jgi:hypothetical protein